MKNPIIVEHVKNFARCFVLVMDQKKSTTPSENGQP